MKSANDEPRPPEQPEQTEVNPPDEIEQICRRLDSLKESMAHGTHAEYVAQFKQNPNSFRVNWISAFYAQRLLPWNYRLAWTCASILEFGLLLGGLALIVFGHWLIGLCAVAVCIGIFMPASRKTACQFILEYSLESEVFWKLMCEGGVLVKVGESLPLPDFLWSDSTEGKTQEALRLVCLIRGREPAGDSSEGQAQAALRLWRSGQREQALDHFNRAVELAPDDAVTLINRANLKYELAGC